MRETYKIKLCDDGTIRDTSARDDGPLLDAQAPVSMNLWGWHPDILDVMEDYFHAFLCNIQPGDIKAECLLPIMMDELISSGKIETMNTPDRWFGITYQEDKQSVQTALKKLHAKGVYPKKLWE